MTDTPKCDLCGREMVRRQDGPGDAEDAYWVCPATPDQHRIAELEKKLAEADFCIAWQADPSDGSDPRYMGRLANMRCMAAQDAAIEREEARKKGAEHGE